MKFVVFQEINQRWYWELRAPTGEPVANSPLGYSSQQKAFDSIQQIKINASRSLVFDLLGNLQEGE